MKKDVYRKFMFVLLAVVLAGVLLNCSGGKEEEEAVERTVVDMAGRSVSLPADVQNIITVYPPATALVIAVDGFEHLVGIESLNANNEVLQDLEPGFDAITNVGHQFRGLNAEELLSLEPDLVIASVRNRKKTMEELESLFPVVYIDVNTIDGLKESIQLLGSAVGKESRAEELVSFFERKMDNVLDIASRVPESERPCVYMTSHTILSTCTEQSIEDYILQVGGGENAAADVAAGGTVGLYPEISLEQLMEWNPDVIVVNSFCSSDTKDRFFSDQRFAEIKAVQDRQVYQMPDYISCWYIGVPEALLGMEWTLSILHPDLVNYRIESEVKEFYSVFYELDITDATVNGLLGG